ncbi:MAG: multicopper oxidase family protein [Patescibacteria group bacterium]|jgi:FtsP/CotA-like multicopper oxidase with cupredoxin domain
MNKIFTLAALTVLVGAGCGITATPKGSAPVIKGTNPTVIETGVVREYTLTADETRWELRPDFSTEVFAYNGQVPGPEIRVKRGDRVKVTLVNKLEDSTTIHWHGIRVPASMDGFPGISQEPVAPGGTFVYEFVVPDAGTFFYHSHVDTDEQVDRGLYGPFIVEPSEGAVSDVVVALDDWLLDDSGNRLDTERTYEETQTDNVLDSVSEATRPSTGGTQHMMADGSVMGGMQHEGMMDHNFDPRINGRYGNILAVNGKMGSAIARVEVPKGGTRLLRFINASNSMTHELKADDGRLLEIVAVDGTSLAKPVRTGTLTISPAKRFDVLLRDQDGKAWSLVEKRATGELRIPITIGGEAGVEPSFTTDAPTPPDLLARRPDAIISVGTDRMMDPTTWTVNGLPYDMMGDNDPLATFRVGTWVKMRFMNGTMMAHQMHLHGVFMTVIARDGKPVTEQYRQDVIVVRPNESVDIAVLADNLGDWVMHCHNLEHEEHGLMAKIRVQ